MTHPLGRLRLLILSAAGLLFAAVLDPKGLIRQLVVGNPTTSGGAPAVSQSAGLAAPTRIPAADHPPPPPEDANEAPNESPAINPVARLTIQDLDKMVSRPLFDPSRRPMPPRVASVAPSPSRQAPMQRRPESKLALVGLISHPEQRMALVRDGATGKHARVKIGDTVNNWRVEQIESQRMRLKQGEWTLDLTLFTN